MDVGRTFVGPSVPCGLAPIDVRLAWTGSGLDFTGMGVGEGAGPVLVTVQPLRNKPSTANKNQVLDRHFPISRSKNRLSSPIPLMVTSSTLLVYQDRAPSHILHLSDFPISHMAKSPNPPFFLPQRDLPSGRSCPSRPTPFLRLRYAAPRGRHRQSKPGSPFCSRSPGLDRCLLELSLVRR